ncbi:hypothetical protein HJC23_002312 [Cyclotella cryptica]|uniref:Plastid lipid-associated protein/fibrillin conserved domain-containing protein n=1 Tax=Cyclotella cryptica TaxID=29204 RepID=A0ABD3QLC3_9STRA|eukprot:CCRYP_004408-RA/>CCRYP_004408-RA protein AED:0.03 eAED:0.03 QI:0/-1/0/1/-1/1/1/0/882
MTRLRRMHRTLIFLPLFVVSSSPTSTFAAAGNLDALHDFSNRFQRRRAGRIPSIPTSFTFLSTTRSKRRKATNRSTSTLLPTHRPRPTTLHHANQQGNNNNDLETPNPLLQPPNNPPSDPYSHYTHQIAIPLSTSTELTSALRSIQTSLVRDCPRLIRACVMPAYLRLPLLYVAAVPPDGTARRGLLLGDDAAVGGRDVDVIIQRVVQDAIQSVVYGEDEDAEEEGVPILLPFRGLELQGEDNSVLFAVGYNVNEESGKKKKKKNVVEDEEDGVYIVNDWSSSPNSATIRPSGYERLERLVTTIQRELETGYGFKTCWPCDEPQGNEFVGEDAAIAALQAKQTKWRPRVPFVRLPPDFYDDLEMDNSQTRTDDGGDNDVGEEEEGGEKDPMAKVDAFFSKGFDGISPTFWYETWAEEDILPSPGVRLRSVAVYRRILSGGGEAESSFYALPSSSTSEAGNGPVVNNAGEREESRNLMDLPLGDGKLMAREARGRAEEWERMSEMERREELEWEEGKARWLEEGRRDSRQMELDDSDLDDEDYSEFDVSIEMGDVTVEGDAAYSTPWSERGVDASVYEATAIAATEPEKPIVEPDVTSDATSDETPSSSSMSSSQQTISTSSEKKRPNIEDNPIFQRFWKGESQLNSQSESTAQTLDGTPSSTDETLPPYPSNEHFVGVWRIVSSPLGVDSLPDDNSSTSTSPQSSDNLILRVDGQVMGGPILDAKYQHKAAGGSWKMFQAVRKSGEGGRSDSQVVQTRFRIRLLVPPEKERVLVMEGEVTRLGFGGKDSSFSSAFVGAGGLLDGMSSDKLLKDDTANSRKDTGGETLIYCGGEAWMEDVDGGRRRKLGPFSLMKLKTVDRSKLIYTVPASRVGVETPDSDVD